jgi:hypothetical protein
VPGRGNHPSRLGWLLFLESAMEGSANVLEDAFCCR